jgi:16S rRNA (guanine527-N7)-methyltransferase
VRSVLDRWLAAVVATPGLTAIRDVETARAVLLDDALRGLDLVAATDGPVVDVGSGGGTPGIPLAASLPGRPVTLLEAERRKCAFLERWTAELPNLSVVWGRAEEQPLEAFGVAVAKALAQPPTAAEWCLPLVREGGLVVLWVGETAEPPSPCGSPASWSRRRRGSWRSARQARRRLAFHVAQASRRSVRSPELSGFRVRPGG